MSGIKQKDNPSTKKFCYSPKCDIIETGFNMLNIYVCKVCKAEVTEAIKKASDERKAMKQLDIATEYLDDALLLPFNEPSDAEDGNEWYGF